MATCIKHGFWDGSGFCPACLEEFKPDVTSVKLVPNAPEDKAEALLKEALDIVTGARRKSYGNPEDNFACIANLWQAYLNRRSPSNITASDVAVMMVLMKCARLAETPSHHDSALDIAGYAACLARCQGR